ncbi:MAG: hypothetical protein VKL39_13650, partial [Leptolyngbyaceae bacterium]|nr:hypothetical protein [Leptolyngbyaceae bacterium]
PSMRDFLEFSDYVPVSDRDIDWLVYDDRYYVYLKQAWALYPDHVVFLGSRAKCYNNPKEWAEETDALKLGSDLIFIRDFRVLVKKDFGQAKQQLLRCYFDVLSRLDNHDRIRPLSSEHVASLVDWEAERYRQQVSI